MRELIDVEGGSGEIYRFRRLDDPGAPPTTAGNFIYVRWDQGEPVILYLGEADSLHVIKARWSEAQAKHQATDVYFRLNVGGEARHRERDDLLQRLKPAMNRAGSPKA
jgi:hypothetical protein